jgi:hypothetical protein
MPTLLLTIGLALAAAPRDLSWSFDPIDLTARRSTVAELVAFANSDAPDLARCDALVAAANGLLAYELQPLATRLLLEIPEASDPARAKAIIAEARGHLEQAAKLLADAAPPGAKHEPVILLRREPLVNLLAFARVFTALWENQNTAPGADDAEAQPAEATSDALRQAMLDLALMMEDDRDRVAHTARLWRACYYLRSGELARAATLLPGPLDPPQGDATIGLHARLLRCRIFNRMHGSYPATIALTARMERKLSAWFPTAGDAAAARRTVAFERRRITTQWQAQLANAGQSERADWCTGAIQRIDEQYFADPNPRSLLALSWAAPEIVPIALPAPESPADEAPDNAVDSNAIEQE